MCQVEIGERSSSVSHAGVLSVLADVETHGGIVAPIVPWSSPAVSGRFLWSDIFYSVASHDNTYANHCRPLQFALTEQTGSSDGRLQPSLVRGWIRLVWPLDHLVRVSDLTRAVRKVGLSASCSELGGLRPP